MESPPYSNHCIPVFKYVLDLVHTEEKLLRTPDLQGTLKAYDVFVPQGEKNQRKMILRELETLFNFWISNLAVLRFGYTEADKYRGTIFPFGSYRLGVDNKGADIDVLCVAPRIIPRKEFFTEFIAWLQVLPVVTECRAIEESFVPVIKLKFSGIEMDLTFARLQLDVIPDDLDLSDDNLLRDLDAECVRSLNGARVNEAILELVPNLENFQLALRAIKLWAKKRGINNNAVGFFGGITWAMLTARICQMFPNDTAASIIHKFFAIFYNWEWPTPVLLKPRTNEALLDLPVWDPIRNPRDGNHLMPVITPSYPQQNSTYNVSQSTKKIIESELFRGLGIMEKIVSGHFSWSKLFEEVNYTKKYEQFLIVYAYAKTEADHVAWRGYIESRIRFLVGYLERGGKIFLAQVDPKYVVGESPVKTSPYCSMWYIGLNVKYSHDVTNSNVDVEESIQKFGAHIIQHGGQINVIKDGMGVTVKQCRAPKSKEEQRSRNRRSAC